ncbi:MAG: DUF2892 domain-containing protein [Opitutus sp.]
MTSSNPTVPTDETQTAANSTASTEFDPMASNNDNDFGTNVGLMVEEKIDVYAAPQSSQNVGRTDQKIRIGVGAALLAAAAFAPVGRGWRIAFAAIGAGELITGVRRHCPVWQALGINTNRDAA